MREELAWAAGFIDGEGTFGAYHFHARRLGLVLSAPQIDPAVLFRLRDALGMGSVVGPYIQKGNRQPRWEYKLYGFEKVQAAIAMLWSFLSSVKKEQAKAALLKTRSIA